MSSPNHGDTCVPPPHGLLAPIQAAAPHLVLVEGAGEGQEGVSAVGVVPPQQDRDRTRPRHPVLELERVDGEPLDLSLELLHALGIILVAGLHYFRKPPQPPR